MTVKRIAVFGLIFAWFTVKSTLIFDHRLVTRCSKVCVGHSLGTKALVARNAREALEDDIPLTLSKAVWDLPP